MNAVKAQANASGKGRKKRREFYWKGKRVLKGLLEYTDLLRRADEKIDEVHNHCK